MLWTSLPFICIFKGLNLRARIRMLIGAIILSLLLGGCGTPAPTFVSPLPSPLTSPLQPTKIPTYTATTGAATAHVVQLPSEWKSTLRAYLAPFYPDSTGKNGFFVLEPSIHRNVEVDAGGFFQVSEVDPGQYVIVIGPSPEESRAITGENGQPRVFIVEANNLLNIGEVRLLSQ